MALIHNTTRLAFFVPALILLQAQGCGCDEEPLEKVRCEYTVTPSGNDQGIEFPETEVGREKVRAFSIENTGSHVLSNFNFEFDDRNGDNYAIIIDEEWPGVLPNTKEFLQIKFQPIAASTNIGSTVTVSHPKLHGVGCASYQIQLYGAAYERPVVEPPFDGGPGPGPGPSDEDAGTPEEPPEIIYVDGGTFIMGPDGGLIPVDIEPEPGEDAGTEEEEEDTPQFFRDGGYPFTENSVFVARGALQEARTGFAAVKLADNRIVVVGGYGRNGQTLDSIEIFDPETGVSRLAARMPSARGEPGAALRSDGKVVIAGGISSVTGGVMLQTIELFDPETGELECPFEQGSCGLNDSGLIPLEHTRLSPIVTVTSSDNIIFALGETITEDGRLPASDGIKIVGDGSSVGALNVASNVGGRFLAANVVMADGAFAVIGGATPDGFVLNDILYFDPNTDSLTKTSATLESYAVHAAAGLMPNGKIAVAGGYGEMGIPNTNHIHLIDNLNGTDANVEKVEFVSGTLAVRYGGSLVPISDDEMLFFGGIDERFTDGEDPPSYLHWFEASVNDSVVPLKTADYIEYKSAGDFWKVLEATALATPRFGHQALALDDARIVVLGGLAVVPRRVAQPAAEFYDPIYETFKTYGLFTQGSAYAPLGEPPFGALLSIGGLDAHTGAVTKRVRRYNVGTDLFNDAPALEEFARRDHSATRLVEEFEQFYLIAGGVSGDNQVLSSLTLYSALFGIEWSLPVALETPRYNHSATLLDDGKILICGGLDSSGAALDTCELVTPPEDPEDLETYDTAAILTLANRMQTERVDHSATLLDNGDVLIAGGGNIENTTADPADLYNMITGDLQPTGFMVRTRRKHAAVFIGGGQVLLAGGEVYVSGVSETATAEIYDREGDEGDGQFNEIAAMSQARAGCSGMLMSDGRVIIVGGRQYSSLPGFPNKALQSAELFDLANAGSGYWALESSFDLRLTYPRADLQLIDVYGTPVIVGGQSHDGDLANATERQTPLFFIEKMVEGNPDGGTAE
ncbi:MAG: hypothetical protein CMH56_14810 [Myxococcales bacterium]|nr:hypothetical protein [Myxococcales bacterium]